MEEQMNDDLEDLYRTVAEQDPEWYNEFVVNILGKDAVMTNEDEDAITVTTSSKDDAEDLITIEPSSSPSDTLSNVHNDDHASLPPSIDIAGSGADQEEKLSTWIGNAKTSLSMVEAENMLGRQQVSTTDGRARATNDSMSSVFDRAVDPFDKASNELLGTNPLERSLEEEQLDQPAPQNRISFTNETNEISETVKPPPRVVVAAAGGAEKKDESSRRDKDVDQVVLFRDMYKPQSFQSVPLTFVRDKLGYSQEEIPYIMPDVLSLIVQDEISKPRKGLPPQWRISENQYKHGLSEDVRIMPFEQAKEIMDQLQRKKDERRRRRLQRPMANTDAGAGSARGQYEDESPPPASYRNPQQNEEIRVRWIPGKGPEKVNPEMEDRYNPRQARDNSMGINEAAPRGFPFDRAAPTEPNDAQPPPRSRSRKKPRNVADPPMGEIPLLPDMDLFRNLLKKEAGMRARILGRDWSDYLKKESKWRLKLYKNFLWELHDLVDGDDFNREQQARRRPPSDSTRRDRYQRKIRYDHMGGSVTRGQRQSRRPRERKIYNPRMDGSARGGQPRQERDPSPPTSRNRGGDGSDDEMLYR